MPAQEREPSIEGGTEYDAWIAELQEYHNRRGTTLDPQPKVGNHRIDLKRLYERVTSEGGYDVVSGTKLKWRQIVEEMRLGGPQALTLPFTLKTVYYKNLVAFEHTKFHNREPPPKEILEDETARGSDTLNRTVENYVRRGAKDDAMANGVGGSQDSGNDGDRMELDDPGSVRATRGLRHAPPQRQLFQGETRPTRQASAQQSSPGITVNGNHSGAPLSSALASYEPRHQNVLNLKPVTTPANNLEGFKTWQKQLRDQQLARMSRKPVSITKPGMMLPGTGFPGPMIYVKTLLSLQSGVLDEQEYALHHLVKISHERGDKYRFDSFPGLAEALIEKVLDIASLVCGIDFSIAYSEDAMLMDDDALDGLRGTRGLAERVKSAAQSESKDKMQTQDYALRLTLINEAALVLRNMVMLEENATYLARLPPARDMLIVLLNLPQRPATVELHNYALEIGEQLTRFYPMTPEDPLFISLLQYVDSTDRGTILNSLRALSKMGVGLNQFPRLESVPLPIVQKICEWVLVEDEELQLACLDFLYLYTATPQNVEVLLSNQNLAGLVHHFCRLLLHSAKVYEMKPPASLPSKPSVSSTPTPAPLSAEETPIPRISQDLLDQLLLFEEPDRSSQWLKCCFEEDPTGEITQIALWQAYQLPFGMYQSQRPMLPAKDFITNVSTTFANASAQVMGGQPPRFVIKGIRPRTVPIDPRGREYMRCLWHTEAGSECGDFARDSSRLWEHVVTRHLEVKRDEENNGKFDVSVPGEAKYACQWAGCDRYSGEGCNTTAFNVGMHLKTHLPDQSGHAFQRGKHNTTTEAGRAAEKTPRITSWQTRNTVVDERQDAAGLPLMSVLVLRNLARVLPRTSSAVKTGRDVVFEVFGPVKERLYYVLAYNISLREYLPTLTNLIDRGSVLHTKPEEGHAKAFGL